MTAVAVLACAATIALGCWQIGRLRQRWATSALLASRLDAAPIVLDGAIGWDAHALDQAQFRLARVQGRYDFEHEVAVANALWEGQLGLRLLTPLVIAGGDRAVLVERGWIPADAAMPADWSRYRLDAEQGSQVDVTGWLRLPRESRGSPPPVGPDRLVGGVNVHQMEAFGGRALLPLYLVAAPAPGSSGPPYRRPPVTDLGSGVHLIAAGQWFAISGIVVVGYLAYVRRHSGPPAQPVAAGAPRGTGPPGPAGP
jgi:surfeit locus 1 family protein